MKMVSHLERLRTSISGEWKMGLNAHFQFIVVLVRALRVQDKNCSFFGHL